MGEWAGITILWILLYGYLIIASIDFGAGFFSFYEKIAQKKYVINGIISRYLSPVWELANVFFILFFVAIIGFFPETAYYYGTALFVPGSIALVLIIIRGTFYTLNQYGARDNKIYSFFYGVTGLFIPAALSISLTISEGGYIDVRGGNVVFLGWNLFTSFYAWTVVFLAIVSILYISAMFFTYYASKVGDEPASEKMRTFALFWSGPTVLASGLAFAALQNQNPEHFANVLNVAWMFLLSLLCFFIAVTLVFQKKVYGVAFCCVLLQFFFAFFGYGMSHLPYVLYPFIKLHTGFALSDMTVALIFALIMGLALLVPSIALLIRLFILNAKYVKGRQK